MGYREDFVNAKCNIAVKLGKGQIKIKCGKSDHKSGYEEGVLIVVAAISAVSNEMWTGKGQDRKNFTEALTVCPSLSVDLKKISIPLLVQELEKKGEVIRATALKKKFLSGVENGSIIQDQYDQPEGAILGLPQFNSMLLKDLREFSYANLLYKEIRCGYSHGYEPGNNASSDPWYGVTTGVSYVNKHDGKGKHSRHIHFTLEWITDVAIKLAIYSDTLPTHNQINKNPWWIEG